MLDIWSAVHRIGGHDLWGEAGESDGFVQMTKGQPTSLRDSLCQTVDPATRFPQGVEASINLDALRGATSLGGRLPELAESSILIATRDQLATAVALIELDGIARRVTLYPLDVKPAHHPAVIVDAGIDAIVSDRQDLHGDLGVARRVSPDLRLVPTRHDRARQRPTEWLLLTRGTTGAPKLLAHTLAGLAGAIATTKNVGTVWGTFDGKRRDGGLQIFFRSMLRRPIGTMPIAVLMLGDVADRLLPGADGSAAVRGGAGAPASWR